MRTNPPAFQPVGPQVSESSGPRNDALVGASEFESNVASYADEQTDG